jgi:hypothetical protein
MNLDSHVRLLTKLSCFRAESSLAGSTDPARQSKDIGQTTGFLAGTISASSV